VRRRAIQVLLATAFAMTVTLPVSAAKPRPPSGTGYYDPIVTAMDAMHQEGRSQAEVDEMLMSDFGWIPVVTTDGGVATLASENSDVDMRTPNVYYNTQQGRYEASAWFYWKNCGTQRCWKDDRPIFCQISNCAFGGRDGFGLSMGKLVTRKTQSFYTYTEGNVRTAYANPWDADDSGATYQNQDKTTCTNYSCYNWDHGLLVYSFTIRAGCPAGNYSIKSKLAHTWDGAAVSSITVTTAGVGVTFSGNSDRWQAVNPIAKNWFPCGT